MRRITVDRVVRGVRLHAHVVDLPAIDRGHSGEVRRRHERHVVFGSTLDHEAVRALDVDQIRAGANVDTCPSIDPAAQAAGLRSRLDEVERVGDAVGAGQVGKATERDTLNFACVGGADRPCDGIGGLTGALQCVAAKAKYATAHEGIDTRERRHRSGRGQAQVDGHRGEIGRVVDRVHRRRAVVVTRAAVDETGDRAACPDVERVVLGAACKDLDADKVGGRRV